MIQILPLGKPEGLPFALIGLDDEGRVWYGTFEYRGKDARRRPRGGPLAPRRRRLPLTGQAALPALAALVLVALRWAVLVGAFLVALYLLVRFVKWAWTDEPDAPRREESPKLPRTAEQWGELLDAATGHTNDGRPICQRCGVPIPVGEGIRLTDEEKKALARSRRVESLPGAFRHASEDDCRPRSN